MAGVRLDIHIDDVRLTEEIQARIRAITPNAALMSDIAEELLASTDERFDAGVGPDGTPWEKSKRAMAEGGLTLVDTAQLVTGITADHSARDLVIGSNDIYAAIHQFGGEAGRGKSVTLPARPYIGVDDADIRMIEDIIMDHTQAYR